jgi:lipoate-protein ligase A
MNDKACDVAERPVAEVSDRVHIAIRLLPFSVADGPRNMAADEVMLEAAIAGTASLRFYTWDPPTVSLGYFQKHEERLRNPQLARLPFVRRATGGGAIVHDHDLTYAIALPAALRRGRSPAEWHCRIHHVLARLLQQREMPVEVVGGERLRQGDLDYACFAVPQPGDVILHGRKVIGGAQRIRAGALLQHGSIQIPDLRAVPGELAEAFAAELGLDGVADDRTALERLRLEELVKEKYVRDAWNRKR